MPDMPVLIADRHVPHADGHGCWANGHGAIFGRNRLASGELNRVPLSYYSMTLCVLFSLRHMASGHALFSVSISSSDREGSHTKTLHFRCNLPQQCFPHSDSALHWCYEEQH